MILRLDNTNELKEQGDDLNAASADGKHAFISYVREDKDEVDRLCRHLENAGIPYWRDRKDLAPGDKWKDKIRDAIASGSIAFLACFSEQSRAKEKSYMNEELHLAVEQYRLRPPDRTWLIPVRFDSGDIPTWNLSTTDTLSDLDYADLFGTDYADNAIKLMEAVKRALGLTGIDSSTRRTALEETSESDKPRSFRQLTKELIRDRDREIDLDDIVSAEVARVRTAMRDAERFPTDWKGGTNNQLALDGAQAANDYWRLTEPFCWSLQVAARYGTAETLTPWVKGLKAFATEACKIAGGHTFLLHLRHVPSLVAVFVAAMASSGQGKWDNFKTLLIDNTVTDRSYDAQPKLSMVETVNPYTPFDNDSITQLLVNALVMGQDLEATQAAIDRKEGMNYHTSSSAWLHRILRPIFDEQFPDDEDYDAAFDSTEVILGLVDQDLLNLRHGADQQRQWLRETHWLGQSTWRSRRHGNPLEEFVDDLAKQYSSYAPLQAGLFGGGYERAKTATEQYRESFNQMRNRFW
ncbi:toll/interleukin-1 receptor domain-containing protein [Mycobacterium sp. SMC-11]|uniref:toll/interleukin-1 receptor domain-containing protein n=1 Tax=Mycobacterium sp. SMC-11 TaxID=3385969 RepID=UPI00390CBDE4